MSRILFCTSIVCIASSLTACGSSPAENTGAWVGDVAWSVENTNPSSVAPICSPSLDANSTSFKGCCPASFAAHIAIAYVGGRPVSVTPNAPQALYDIDGALNFSLSSLDNNLLSFGQTAALPFPAILESQDITYTYDSQLIQVSELYAAPSLPAGSVTFNCTYKGTLKKQ